MVSWSQPTVQWSQPANQRTKFAIKLNQAEQKSHKYIVHCNREQFVSADKFVKIQGVPKKREIKKFNFLTQYLGLQTALRKVFVLKIKLSMSIHIMNI